MAQLKFHYGGCKNLSVEIAELCGGKSRVSRNLDMGDTFTSYIEQVSPVNFLRSKRLESSGLEGKLIGAKSSINTLWKTCR